MPTVEIPDKICPHCGGIKWKTEYRKSTKDPNVKILMYRCAVKGNERNYKWKRENPEKAREHNKRSCRNRRANGYYKTPKEQERNRQRAKKDSTTLCDNYVYRIIFNDPEIKHLSRSDIPQELIETKRKQLLLKRQIRNDAKDKSS
jgi:hypothetical protein